MGWGTGMNANDCKGWSVRVLARKAADPRYPVSWYIVGARDAEEAAIAVRRTLDAARGVEDEVSVVQEVSPIVQGRRLTRGEAVYLFRRGPPRS